MTAAFSWSGEEVCSKQYGAGPILVRHADVVVTDDGQAHEVTRPVVALCTCERSRRMPWCDSTHKSLRRG
jgi:CDGSH-type Zn-finger protein